MLRQDSAKKFDALIGVDTDSATKRLKSIPISMHCQQTDDTRCFVDAEVIMAALNKRRVYIGRARNPDEFMADIEKVNLLIG